MLELLEDPKFSSASLREFQNLWCWVDHYYHDISQRLARFEKRLEDGNIRRCTLSEECNGVGMIRLITGMQDRLFEERKHLTSWLKGCQDITIVDSYFFSFSGPNKVFLTLGHYTKWLENELILS